MIKLSSTARVLFGTACLAVAGMSVAGCGTSANASSPGSGSGAAAAVSANAQTSAVPVVSLPANTAPASTAPGAPSSSSSGAPSSGGAGAPAQQPAPNQGAATSPAAAAPGSARCHTSDLAASYNVVADSAAAGSISYNLRLINTSTHQCTIYGYPGMLLLDANHKPLPTNVQWDTLVPKRLLRLNPGGSAAATVRFSPDVNGVGDNPGPTCQPKAYYTEVTPPDETTQLVTAVSPPTSVCERGRMAVSAFVAGRTGPNQ